MTGRRIERPLSRRAHIDCSALAEQLAQSGAPITYVSDGKEPRFVVLTVELWTAISNLPLWKAVQDPEEPSDPSASVATHIGGAAEPISPDTSAKLSSQSVKTSSRADSLGAKWAAWRGHHR